MAITCESPVQTAIIDGGKNNQIRGAPHDRQAADARGS